MLPDEFMHDEPVVAALARLSAALDAALIARGLEVKSIVVGIHSTGNMRAGSYAGCGCLMCKTTATAIANAAAACGLLALPASLTGATDQATVH